jgi:hypothetical protein
VLGLSIQNIVINGRFETGTIAPWVSMNAVVTSQYAHSDFYSVRLQGGNIVSYIAQIVPVNPGSYEFFVSLAKVSSLPSPPVQAHLIARLIFWRRAGF